MYDLFNLKQRIATIICTDIQRNYVWTEKKCIYVVYDTKEENWE